MQSDVSPVSAVVDRTVLLGQPRPLRSRSWRIEMFVGLMLLFRRALRLTLFLLVAQMVGTFLTFIILSEVTDGTRCC